MADLSEEQAEALEAATTAAVEEPHPAQLMGARELVDLLLESLSPKDRMLVRMLELEERSISEVSELTGWSATVIRVRAFRARRRLNKRFAELRKERQL